MLRGATAVGAGVCLAIGLGVSAPSSVDLGMASTDAALIEGTHAPERMYARVARWTSGAAHIEWSGQYGVRATAVEIELAPFFGRAGDQVEIAAGPRVVRHTLGSDWEVVRFSLAPPGQRPTIGWHRLAIDIRSDVHEAQPDPRQLGVRLDRVSIVNGSPWTSWAREGWLSLTVLVGAGALAWGAGLWLAACRGDRAQRVSAALVVALLGAALHATRAWMLTPSGLAILAGGCVLALALTRVLRRSAADSRGAVLGIAVACTVLWMGNAVLTSWYWVDVLRLDAWESVALVERSLNGSLSLADLVGPHNEHRPLTGRLIALACARLSAWNHWWEFASLQLVAALQILLLAVSLGLRQARRFQPVVLVAATACFCSAMHWETWLRGFSVHILIGVLAPMAALFMLCQRTPTWRSIAAAAGAGLVGQFSFGAALLVWPLGALAVAVRRQVAWRSQLGAWLVVGGVAMALYVPGLQVHPGAGGSLGDTLSPAGLLWIGEGVLVTLGMAIYYAPALFDGGNPAHQTVLITVTGLAVATWCAAVVRQWWQDDTRECAWVFPAVVGMFGLGACLMASAGRIYGGLLAMTASRYLIFAACFWASLFWLMAMHKEPRGAWAGTFTRIATAAVVVAMIAASAAAIPYMAAERVRVRQARDQLLRGDVGAAAFVLYPDPYKLLHMRDVLQRHRLSVFRDGAR